MLSVAILAFVTFFVTQLVKPILKASFLPQDKDWSNTALRGIVFLIAYIAVLLNTIAQHRLDWSGAWGLLTTAGVVFAVAVASYHVLDDNPATPTLPGDAPVIQTATAKPTQPRVAGKFAKSSGTATITATTTPPASSAAGIILPEAAHPDPSAGTTGG